MPASRDNRKTFCLRAGNPLSQFSLFWVTRLAVLCGRTSDLRDLPLRLSTAESAKATGNILEECWSAEYQDQGKYVATFFFSFFFPFCPLLSLLVVLLLLFEKAPLFFLNNDTLKAKRRKIIE